MADPSFHSAILGYGDFLIDPLLRMPSAPLMDSGWASSFIVGWDAAAAALLMEDALRKRPQDVRGSPFLVTGKDEPWAYGKLRHTAKVCAALPLSNDSAYVLLVSESVTP